MKVTDPMMSQESVLHSSIRDEGDNIRQRLAQHLAETNQWVTLLQARFLAADPTNGAPIDLQTIGDELAQRRSENEGLREEIGQHRRRSEQLQLALDTATAAKAELDEKMAQLQPLAQNVASIESQLRQREEEVHQAYAELKRQQDHAEQQARDAEVLEGEIEKLRTKLIDADKWIFRLAEERRDSEYALAASQIRVAHAEKVAAAQQGQARRHADALLEREKKLAEQRHEIERLGKALDEARSKFEAASHCGEDQQVSYATDIYPLGLEIRRLGDDKRLAEHKCWRAEQETQRLVQEVSFLTRILYEAREKAEKLEAEKLSLLNESAKAALLSKELQTAYDTQERFAGLLIELQAYGEKLERKSTRDKNEQEAVKAKLDRETTSCLWMARLSEVLMQRRPFWWHLAPGKWRSKWTYATLRQRGIFDADKYCDMYPDVPAAGMDPLEHYVRHGMQEGRSCPL